MNYKMGNQRSGLANQRLRGNTIEKPQGRAGTVVRVKSNVVKF